MNFNNWLEKLKSNRDNFIEYYVNQFGEDNRDIITERFDSLKFCFYVNPNDIQYWCFLKLTDEYIIATYKFLKDYAPKFDIDVTSLSLNFDKDLGDIEIQSNDKKSKYKIRNIFGTGKIANYLVPDSSNFYNIYSFRILEDFKNGDGKEYDNPEKELLHRQLLFLKNMGDITIDGAPIDFFESEECRKFVNSPKFKELSKKYHELAEKALIYKKEVDDKYKDLINYMNNSISHEEQIIKKFDMLKQGTDDTKKLKEYDILSKKEIAISRIICCNFDVSKYLDDTDILKNIVDSMDTQIAIVNKYGDRFILFCPFRSVPDYEDVDLRHEIRHAITSSISTDKDTIIYKVGNKIEKFNGEEFIESHLSNYNEWVTQIEAKKETQYAFSKGIYIISKPSLKNHKFIGKTSDCDIYLSFFDIIYNALSKSAKQSQIESSNDSLYSFVSLEQLKYIEDMILKGNIDSHELIEKLNIIAEQLKNNQNNQKIVRI